MGGYSIAESLVWGDKNSDIHKQEFDMILLADCIYYEDVIDILLQNNYILFRNTCNLYTFFFQAVDPLFETLKNLNNSVNKKPTIYLTQELRDSEIQKRLWKSFYEKLAEFFYIEKVPEEQQHINYRSSDITLLKITKK